jgi:hypothetical protein
LLSAAFRAVKDDSAQMGDVVHVDFRKAGEPDLERLVASQLSESLAKILGHERPDIAALIAGDYTRCLSRVRDLFAFSLGFPADTPDEHAQITRRVIEGAVRAVAIELGVIRDEIAVVMGTLAHAVMVDTAMSLVKKDNGAA